MNSYLHITAPEGRTWTVPVADEPVTIGRDRSCDVVLDDDKASRVHARLSPTADGSFILTDLQSTNGVRVNQTPIAADTTVSMNDVIGIGRHELLITAAMPEEDLAEATHLEFASSSGNATDGDETSGELTEQLLAAAVWQDRNLEDAGIPIVDAPFVTVGGGLGSFAFVDYLRIAGVPESEIAVLTPNTRPTQTYEFLADNSQVPRHERLRSDSGSVMDNIWGFPSYAVREAFAAKGLKAKLAPLWQVTTEPIFAEYYTPRSGQVYESVNRETKRIGWSRMLRSGQVRMVRQRAGGGYFVILTPPPGSTPTRRVAYRCRYVHLALGYPGVRFLDDLRDYREQTGDHRRVVNSYEPHAHVYAEVARRPCTVMVRGSGIVASRVLQRLLDDNEAGRTNTKIVHLFRTYVDGPQGDSPTFRRDGGEGFAYQAFNYPKASWGGQFRNTLLELEGDERSDFIDRTGGTNTAPRQSWRDQLARAGQAGTYVQHVGQVQSVEPTDDGQHVRTVVTDPNGQAVSIDADFIVDATGLEASIRANRVLADLVDVTGAETNPKGRLETLETFEVAGTRNESGRLYACGSSTLGSKYAPVDSFLGLQYVAQQVIDDLAAIGAIKHIGPLRSLREWWRWMMNRPPA